jgi:hypothetical protein
VSYEVFISYAHDDKKAADAVCHALEHGGIRCWIAPRDILPGVEWGAAIVDAIDMVRVMVLVFSASSNRSPQVRREIERAVNKGVAVLPFRIEEVFPCKTLEYFLGTQHWLDAFQKPLEPHIEVLTRTVRTILAGSDESVPSFAVSDFDAMAEAHSVQQTAACPQEAAGRFEPAELEKVRAGLAEHIGPVARLLVCREAGRAGTLSELVERLAGELADDRERAAFLNLFGAGAR